MEVETKVYRAPKLRTKRIAGIPVSLLAFLAISGIVAAAVLGPTLTRTQAVTAITLQEQSSPNGVENPLAYGIVDTVVFDASNTGASAVSGFYIQVTVSMGCLAFSQNIADSSGAAGLGKVEFKPLPAGVYASITVPTSGGSPCSFATPTFTLPAGSTTSAASFKWQWLGPAPPASVTWTFTPSGP